ncbi:Fas apoptotic inhibitory molecule 2 [Pteropus alecto]|uniref:Fas apoptotic inhibitory molecule 2 n=1 Tax=Pteropus alecto TaxID=9402 RepID=L5KMH3_PTEAL|nr:Fas apoptotic inhibitory molecule 2 [Pteropus alecto]
MDLGVSEPIDLSAGDHQHLILKAADDNVQTKSKRSYNTSPSFGQQQTHGEPHSKASKQEDTFVVQISDETTPNDSSTLVSPFSEASVRRAFIVKVFLLLSAQLVVTGAIISLFLFCCQSIEGPFLAGVGTLLIDQWLHLMYAGLGTVVFSLYLVMDVQLMVGGRHHHSDMDPEEYVFAALNIYLDIVEIFFFILQLIGLVR